MRIVDASRAKDARCEQVLQQEVLVTIEDKKDYADCVAHIHQDEMRASDIGIIVVLSLFSALIVLSLWNMINTYKDKHLD